ncbi:hypothetical protein AB0E04_41940, partial [Streptomyces sp. NPDC048251]
MTTTPRSPRLLMLSTVMLAVAGIALLGVPNGQEPPAAATASHATEDPSSAVSGAGRRPTHWCPRPQVGAPPSPERSVGA